MSYILSNPRLASCANSVAIERRIAIEHQLTPYSAGSMNDHDRKVVEMELEAAFAKGYELALADRNLPR